MVTVWDFVDVVITSVVIVGGGVLVVGVAVTVHSVVDAVVVTVHSVVVVVILAVVLTERCVGYYS